MPNFPIIAQTLKKIGVAELSNELCLFTFCIKHETCVEISAMLRLFQCEITFSYFCSATPKF